MHQSLQARGQARGLAWQPCSGSYRSVHRHCRAQGQRGQQQACAAAVTTEPSTSAPPRVAYPSLPHTSSARFQQGNTVFTEEFRIRGNEAGPDQCTSIITIANLLQEVGGNHGVGLWGRAESGFAAMPGMDHLIFVATRLQIRMNAYPKWGDLVRLETYFAEDGRLTTRRDWRIIDVSTGQQLGAATSTWVTINSDTRKLSKLPEEVKQRFLTLASDGYAVPVTDTRRKLPDFELPAVYEGPVVVARRSDMDPNGHINNVAYLAWAMDAVPEHIYENYTLFEVEMDFKAECVAGDQVECLAMPLTTGFGASPSSNGASHGVSNGASNGASNGTRNGTSKGTSNGASSGSNVPQTEQLLHMLQKVGADGTQEVWRARTTWVPKVRAATSAASSSSSDSDSDNEGSLASWAAAASQMLASLLNGRSNGNGNGKHA